MSITVIKLHFHFILECWKSVFQRWLGMLHILQGNKWGVITWNENAYAVYTVSLSISMRLNYLMQYPSCNKWALQEFLPWPSFNCMFIFLLCHRVWEIIDLLRTLHFVLLGVFHSVPQVCEPLAMMFVQQMYSLWIGKRLPKKSKW